MQIPHVNRQEYTLLDVSEDGYVSAACSLAFASHSTHWLLKFLQYKSCRVEYERMNV